MEKEKRRREEVRRTEYLSVGGDGGREGVEKMEEGSIGIYRTKVSGTCGKTCLQYTMV